VGVDSKRDYPQAKAFIAIPSGVDERQNRILYERAKSELLLQIDFRYLIAL